MIFIQFQLPSSPPKPSELEIQKNKAIEKIYRRLDFLMSATDDEDLLKLQLELLSRIDGTVNELIWNGETGEAQSI